MFMTSIQECPYLVLMMAAFILQGHLIDIYFLLICINLFISSLNGGCRTPASDEKYQTLVFYSFQHEVKSYFVTSNDISISSASL